MTYIFTHIGQGNNIKIINIFIIKKSVFTEIMRGKKKVTIYASCLHNNTSS